MFSFKSFVILLFRSKTDFHTKFGSKLDNKLFSLKIVQNRFLSFYVFEILLNLLKFLQFCANFLNILNLDIILNLINNFKFIFIQQQQKITITRKNIMNLI